VLLFLTDGLPTEGVTEISQIIANTKHNSTSYLRLFAFGVGDDVNTELLDSLSSDNGGLVNYVRPNERIDEEVSSLYARIQSPVLSDLVLDFGNVQVEEIYPPSLPDLFSGTQLLVAGRYRLESNQSGRTEVSLSGMVNGEKQIYKKQVRFLKNSERDGANSFIPRLWAARKIGYLLNQIRYQGENSEWVDAVIKLSLRYGIITPYTSFLIQEDDIFSQEGWSDAADELAREYAGPAVGADAVEKAESESNLRSAESVPQPMLPLETHSGFVGDPVLKYVDDKTFFLQNGIWIDSQYDLEGMDVVRISFGSEVYFDLLENQPSLGKIMALGNQVIFVINGNAYEIIPEGEGISSLPQELFQSENTHQPELGKIDRTEQARRSFCNVPFLTALVWLGWCRKRTP
jgi:Ca-activated chloride channel family protein